ncbi:sensor histidine kinase [Canibacter sp. lx-72]|uniref:sensor histidine kinase n=1 Tax=Canibacter zhuwentaonis TaxID=2837491 RepID=UPI001BDBD991|nr:sensor histidine kinase [Canibacter zhuwentaonis]MBT1017738.1 sensor histidine kinase [Canibacter zhuwentaonis]MBT1034894.1 sensor histidine kinase [Canibacter zhuwentaonis]
MSNLAEMAEKYTNLNEEEISWLQALVRDWSLLADLALGDVVLWVPTKDCEYLAVAHNRPTGLITVFYRSVIGDYLRADWVDLLERALTTNCPAIGSALTWYEEAPMHLSAYPIVRRNPDTGEKTAPFAVLTVHNAANESYSANRMGAAFRECADDLLMMIQNGDFPSRSGHNGRLRGAPRAGDGLIRLDTAGNITFASPNTLTSFGKLGHRAELEDENFADVVASITAGTYDTNESMPLICAGKIASRADVEARGNTITVRSIPVINQGKRVGGIILTRDITDIKQQTQELITKNATIREIHHRVKNNLQTVASLLRVQARRAQSDEAKQVLEQAMRRVTAIAVVHDTLASGLDQIVDFDAVFGRVLGLAAEVASHGKSAQLHKKGKFGQIPSEHATALALALTEIVTNAVEHGLVGGEGNVTVATERVEGKLVVRVIDDGVGLPEGNVVEGLGTQIVRILIEAELGGSINWSNGANGGAVVEIQLPIRW